MPVHNLQRRLSRVLFAGYMWRGSTCIPRSEGLRSLGLDLSVFDSTPVYQSAYRIVNSLSHRFFCTLRVKQMNRTLVKECLRTAPDVVWIEKGDWIFPSTIRKLRMHTRFVVHYNTDDIFGKQTWFWLHRKGMALYDVLMTTNRFNIGEIRNRCGSSALRVGMGHDRSVHRPQSVDGRKEYDVVFIGHWEPHTEGYVLALRSAGIRVDVWGPHWQKSGRPEFRKTHPLEQDEYLSVLSRSRLALCSLSRRNRNESTGRSYEIPAVGMCMLAERTDEHAFLFRHGEEALLFSDADELIRHARFALDNDSSRERIALNGRRRITHLGLSWQDHMEREWPLVERRLLTGKTGFTTEDDHPFWTGFRAGEQPPAQAERFTADRESTYGEKLCR